MEKMETKQSDYKVLYDGHFSILEKMGQEIVKVNNAVGAVIYDTKKQKYIFVEQNRPSVDGKTVEICAGGIDMGETVEEALKREVLEETGYKVDTMDHICDYYPSVGYSQEIMSLFYVEVSEKIGDGGGIGDENIIIVEVDDLGYGGNLIFKGDNGELIPPYKLIDGKSIIAVNHIEHNNILKNTIKVLTDAKFKTF